MLFTQIEGPFSGPRWVEMILQHMCAHESLKKHDVTCFGFKIKPVSYQHV